MFEQIRLIVLGFVAGFIDSIAGGGGLITIPTLALSMGLTPETIGTNKIAASVAAGLAFLVYMRKGHFKLSKGIVFSIFIAVGSVIGSQATQHVPSVFYKYFLLLSAPIILWLIFNKKLWQVQVQDHPQLDSKKQKILLCIAGLLVGFYDGLWGPGGGTFMLLSLLFISKLPLMTAIAISKFANLVSALSSLSGFAYSGLVVWKTGFIFMIPVGIGALVGAQLATKKAEKIVRPILVVVVILLLVKIYFE